jgi:hypothetical protein
MTSMALLSSEALETVGILILFSEVNVQFVIITDNWTGQGYSKYEAKCL